MRYLIFVVASASSAIGNASLLNRTSSVNYLDPSFECRVQALLRLYGCFFPRLFAFYEASWSKIR
ncbi:MAG: hypothetical protein WCH30_07895 [Chlorobiaceae bacterium]